MPAIKLCFFLSNNYLVLLINIIFSQHLSFFIILLVANITYIKVLLYYINCVNEILCPVVAY